MECQFSRQRQRDAEKGDQQDTEVMRRDNAQTLKTPEAQTPSKDIPYMSFTENLSVMTFTLLWEPLGSDYI